MALTQDVINEFAALVANEDQMIWEIGDKIISYELGREDIEVLAEEVERTYLTLWHRSRLAKMFPADEWDRQSAPIGVFEQLSRLDNPLQRARLFQKKAWTVNALRKEIDKLLLDKDPALPIAVSTRVTRYLVDGQSVAMKSVLSADGVLSLTLPAALAPGTKVEAVTGDDGAVHVNIPLVIGDNRRLKAVK